MGTPHRVYYIQPSLASNASVFVGREGELYTHSRGAFSIARFDNLGNAKALTSGTSSRLAPRFLFFVYLRNIILTANRESLAYWIIKTMKAVKLLLFIVFAICATSSYAQLSKEQVKVRKEIQRASKSELNEKASKAARKEAKKLQKEGWTNAPGALPLEKQLDKSYTMQMEYDEEMFPKYLIGEAMSVGQNYDAAKMQALELAKQNLAGQIQTEVTALIENTVSNKQLEPNEAASIVQSVSAGKSLISQSIGRVITIVEVYRTLPNKNKEVLVKIAYNSAMAKAAAKSSVKKDLEQRGDNLQKKLDELLGW